jgi:superfamily II DNA/RNA helicase
MSNSKQTTLESWEDADGWESVRKQEPESTKQDDYKSTIQDDYKSSKQDEFVDQEDENFFVKCQKFSEMGMKPELLECVHNAKFHTPRTHQKVVIPTIIALYNEAVAKNETPRDVLVCAPTASGKTLSFALSAINSIDDTVRLTQVIIIVQQRELAGEIYERICALVAPDADMPKNAGRYRSRKANKNLYTVALHRGTYSNNNDPTSQKHAQKYFTSATDIADIGNEQIIVATVARLNHLISEPAFVGEEYSSKFAEIAKKEGKRINHKTRKQEYCCVQIKTDCLQELVMDEADQLFNNNGQTSEIIMDIVDAIPDFTRIIMFSATLSEPVRIFADERKAILMEFKATEKTNANISHYFVKIADEHDKIDCLIEILEKIKISGSTIIFASSITMLRTICRNLDSNGFNNIIIHGQMTQKQRDKAFKDFSTGDYRVIVSTDLLGRGIDNGYVDLVINYDIPDDGHITYQHRAGRSGRAGIPGTCISLIETNNNSIPPIISKISKAMNVPIHPLPNDLLT